MIQVFLNAISLACLNTLLAVSFWLLYAPTKSFYFTHAAAITFGAYGGYWLNRHAGVPMIPAAVLAALIVAAIFCALDHWLFRSLRGNGRTWPGMVASIGVYVVLQNTVSLGFGDETRVLRSAAVQTSYEIGGAFLAVGQLWIIIVSIGLSALIWFLLRYSRLGRQIRGIASNPTLSVLLGVDPRRVTLCAVALGSALAAVGGVLSALDTDMSPLMGFRLLMGGVVVMIVGGTGSILGMMGAALFLAMAQHCAAYWFDAKWMDTVAYLLLIAFLVWKPSGFDGKKLKKVEV